MEVYEPDMLEKIEGMPRPKMANLKITIQPGSFDDPESFESGVHIGTKAIVSRRESVDRLRLSPRAAGATEGSRARYGLRKTQKLSMKKREA